MPNKIMTRLIKFWTAVVLVKSNRLVILLQKIYLLTVLDQVWIALESKVSDSLTGLKKIE